MGMFIISCRKAEHNERLYSDFAAWQCSSQCYESGQYISHSYFPSITCSVHRLKDTSSLDFINGIWPLWPILWIINIHFFYNKTWHLGKKQHNKVWYLIKSQNYIFYSINSGILWLYLVDMIYFYVNWLEKTNNRHYLCQSYRSKQLADRFELFIT